MSDPKNIDPQLVQLRWVVEQATQGLKAARELLVKAQADLHAKEAELRQIDKVERQATIEVEMKNLTLTLSKSFDEWLSAKRQEFAEYKIALELSDTHKTAIPAKPKMVWEVQAVDGVLPGTVLKAAGQVLISYNEQRVAQNKKVLMATVKLVRGNSE